MFRSSANISDEVKQLSESVMSINIQVKQDRAEDATLRNATGNETYTRKRSSCPDSLNPAVQK